jgi:NADH-quinone oxidoreductase subunit N
MHLPFSHQDIKLVFPHIVVAVFILLMLFSWSPAKRGKAFGEVFTALVAVILAAFFTMQQWDISAVAFNSAIIGDNYSRAFGFLFFIIAGITILQAPERSDGAGGAGRAGTFILILVALLGMMLAASAGNIIVAFIAIEITGFAISAFVEINSLKKQGEGENDTVARRPGIRRNPVYIAAVFLLIIGIACVIHAAGTINFFDIKDHFTIGQSHRKEILFGFLLMSPWILMKTALPVIGFRNSPAGLSNMPAPLVWFVTTGPKAAAFAVLFRVLYIALPKLMGEWFGFIGAAAVLAMTAGNIAALLQMELKKIFAAVGIAHAGFVLVAVAAGGEFGNVSLLFYLYVYAMAGAGAFGLLALLEREKEDAVTLSDIAGLERKHYIFTALMTLFLISLAGIPLTAGFAGLMRVFLSSIKAKQGLLAAVMGLNVVVTACVYIRIIIVMYVSKSHREMKFGAPRFFSVVIIAISAAGVIALGVMPHVIRFVLIIFKNSVIYFD